MTIRFLRPFSLGCAAMVAMACSYAGAQAAPGNMQGNMQLESANASLVQTVDSKNATQGQKVTAKLTTNVKAAGETELPKGTILLGQVEQVEPSTNNGPSKLTIVFDQAKLSTGQTIPVKATIMGAYRENDDSYYSDTSNNGTITAVQPKVIQDDAQVDQTPGALGQVEMHSAVQSNASAVFTSKDRNINLKRGTRLQLAIGESGTPAATSGQ